MDSESLNAFQILFEAVPGLYLVLDPDLFIIAVSDAYLEATMTTRHKILGKHLFDVFPDNPDDTEAKGVSNLRRSLERVKSRKVRDVMPLQKYDVRGPDGHFVEKYWSPINSPVLDGAGHLHFIIHRVEDVTEYVEYKNKKKLGNRSEGKDVASFSENLEAELFLRAREIKCMSDELYEANERLLAERQSRETLINGLVHDFRNALNAVGMMAETIRSTSMECGTREVARKIGKNIDRSVGMVENLLDSSRIKAGEQLQLTVEKINLKQLLEDVHGDLKAFHGDRVVLNARSEAIGHWDKGALRRVVENLVSNAVKYGSSEEPITIELDDDGDLTYIKVHNFGGELEKRDVDVLFEEFNRGDSSSFARRKGWGVGLTVVKGLVEAHGGAVTVESHEGAGTTFTVKLTRATPSN